VAFEIRVDGETVHEIDIDPRLVTGVSLMSAQGEAGVAGSPLSGEGNNWVNLTLKVQQPTALPVVEDNARLAAEENKDEYLVHNPVAVQTEENIGKPAEDAENLPEEKADPGNHTPEEKPAKSEKTTEKVPASK
jgi:hypothetical protein